MHSRAGAVEVPGWVLRTKTRLHPPCDVLMMLFKFITRTLVYEYAGLAQMPCTSSFEGQAEWHVANPEVVEAGFRRDAKRLQRFQKYLQWRYAGLVLMGDGRWIAYGWCSGPQAAPPHLPRWVSTLDSYWIFGCHTHERYRCRGIYKQLLARLTALALEKQPSATIRIDTHAENVPSQRAIVAAGFRPRGVFSSYRVWAPLIGPRIIAGRWRREEDHPDLIRGAVKDGANVAGVLLSGGVPRKIRSDHRAANFDCH